MAQGGEEGAGLPVAVRNGADQALAARGAAIDARHVGLHPSLVDEDQPRSFELRLALAPSLPRRGNIGPLLLGGTERLFLSVRPNASR